MIETLDKVDKDRRCFRLVGGVLVERKVGEVEPALIGNSAKVTKGLIRVSSPRHHIDCHEFGSNLNSAQLKSIYL